MSFNKNSIKDALVEALSIEKFAIESAKKSMEESMAPKIQQVVVDSLKELESLTNKESVDNEESSVTIAESSNTIVVPSLTISNSIPNAMLTVDSTGTVKLTTDLKENSNPVTEMNNTPLEEEEMFEIEGLSEEIPAPPVAPATSAAAPVGDPSTGGAMAEPSAVDGTPAEQEILKKLDALLAASGVDASNPGAGEGEVQVVDDDSTADPNAMAAPAPGAPAAQPVNEFDTMFEIEDDISSLFEDESAEGEEDSKEFSLDELEGIEEIEIVDEDEVVEGEEVVDEMKGVSNTVIRSQRNREDFKNAKLTHSPQSDLNESAKIKAQYESKIDELIQENARLKGAVKEYKDSFVELRQQVNEMQVFNGKLAYANRLLTTAGITSEEKLTIAEAFDKVDTVEEAKKLYNKLINEMKSPKGSSSTVDKLKASTKPSVEKPKEGKVQESQSETLYESAERKRMKELMLYGSKKS